MAVEKLIRLETFVELPVVAVPVVAKMSYSALTDPVFPVPAIVTTPDILKVEVEVTPMGHVVEDVTIVVVPILRPHDQLFGHAFVENRPRAVILMVRPVATHPAGNVVLPTNPCPDSAVKVLKAVDVLIVTAEVD